MINISCILLVVVYLVSNSKQFQKVQSKNILKQCLSESAEFLPIEKMFKLSSSSCSFLFVKTEHRFYIA